jgi:hypothetical protein
LVYNLYFFIYYDQVSQNHLIRGKLVAKTKTKTKTKTEAKIKIPAADRSKLDLSLDALAKAGTTKKKASSNARPELQLSKEAQDLFRKFAPAKELSDYFKSHFSQSRSDFLDVAWREFVDFMWSQKTQPKNPSLSTKGEDGFPDCAGQFVVVAKLSVDAEGPEQAVEKLVDQDIQLEDAERLVAEELDFTPMTGIKPLNHLRNGRKEAGAWIDATEAEKEAAIKLQTVLMSDAFTDEERQLLITSHSSVAVKSGFLNRACTYANSADQLDALLSIVKPQVQLRSVKFAVSDTIEDAASRKIEEAADILGVALRVNEDE